MGLTAIALIAVLFMYGAIPGCLTPTVGQAVWSMSFSNAMAHQPFLGSEAIEFGFPIKNAIAFGAAGAWVASLFVRAGFSSADSYSFMTAFWLTVAFLGAWKAVRSLEQVIGVASPSRWTPLLSATTWTTLPIIWGHIGYSMLSLGISLLPLYLSSAIDLAHNKESLRATAFKYSLVAIVSVFMDGYTFMMFFTGATVILLLVGPVSRGANVRDVVRNLAIHIACFAAAALIYVSYSGSSDFGRHPMEFFRAWGVDLSYVFVPTAGQYWLMDWMGLSVARSDVSNFGDESVWATTFCAPLILLAVFAAYRLRKDTLVVALISVFVISFYLAMGPSLKINSQKPAAMQSVEHPQATALMPEDAAVMPTGNSWIYRNLPGFRDMRATYRWIALAQTSAWMLLILGALSHGSSNKEQRTRGVLLSRPRVDRWYVLALASLLAFNAQNLVSRHIIYKENREIFTRIDGELSAEIGSHVSRGELVAFIPAGNDFLAGYLATRVGFLTFNVGGDKNYVMTRGSWPVEIRELSDGVRGLGEELRVVGKSDDERVGLLKRKMVSDVFRLLGEGRADVIVVPYIDLLRPEWLYCLPRHECRQPDLVGAKGFVDELRVVDGLRVYETESFVSVRILR